MPTRVEIDQVRSTVAREKLMVGITCQQFLFWGGKDDKDNDLET